MNVLSLAEPRPTWALILKKAPSKAKTRLASVLCDEERRNLIEKLFQHVLRQALDTAGIHRLAIVSPEQPVLPEGVLWIRDTSDDMNECIIQGISEAKGRGAERILVLPSDLPLVSNKDLEEMLRDGGQYDVVIAPDEFEEGTNALLLDSSRNFKPMFGVNSFRKHLAQARRLGLKTRVACIPGIAFDLDDQRDWEKYCSTNDTLKTAIPQ